MVNSFTAVVECRIIGWHHLVHAFSIAGRSALTTGGAAENLQLYFVEMHKFHKEWSEIQTDRDQWIAFLPQGETLTRSSLPPAVSCESMITKAVFQSERMGVDPRLREFMRQRRKQKWSI